VGSESSAEELRHPSEFSKDLEALRAKNEKLESERDQYRALYLAMLEQCKKLERGILAGQKAERLSPNEAQLTLQLLGTLLALRELPIPPATQEPQKKPRPAKQRPTGRKPLPENLPRVEIEIVPEEVQREGLDAFERIGEDVCEVVERRPGSLVVLRIVKPKFVRKDRNRHAPTQVAVAPALERPIARGLAGPGLLADTIVRRWQDHLPLNRLEQIYAREGLELARSTVCGWHAELAASVRPLLQAMWKDAHHSPYLCTDATGVLVQAKERCRAGHFFVVLAPERHVLFHYSPKHNSDAVDQMLAGYQGYLVADAHVIYDHLYAKGTVIEVACWAHCRRYFFKALSSDPERARQALALIGGLFEIERKQASASRKERHAVRQTQSKPIVDVFFAWCEAQALHVLDDTPISDGIRYARNQRKALEQFLQDGQLPIHNNGSELQLRRQAVGRKAWLFVGSDPAAEVNTTFVSLLASCQMHKIEPWSYLRDLFCLLPDWPVRRVLELAPVSWRQTLEQPHAQQRLAANPFRNLSLGKIP
jgi:transposase